MANCATCGKTVFFGKKKDGHAFCDGKCAKAFDGSAAVPAKPMSVGEQVFIALPLALIFVGGLLGGLCGGIASYCNARIFKSGLGQPTKFLIASAITVAAALLWFVAAMLVATTLRPAQ